VDFLRLTSIDYVDKQGVKMKMATKIVAFSIILIPAISFWAMAEPAGVEINL